MEKSMELKLNRTRDRWMVLAGMALTFIGLIVPYLRVAADDAVVDAGLYNVFTAASAFNQGGIAQISTFVVIVWLAALAEIVVFFCVKNIIWDYVTWLLAACFGLAELVVLISEDYGALGNPFGFMFVGSYIAFAGMILALVALVFQAMHIQK